MRTFDDGMEQLMNPTRHSPIKRMPTLVGLKIPHEREICATSVRYRKNLCPDGLLCVVMIGVEDDKYLSELKIIL